MRTRQTRSWEDSNVFNPGACSVVEEVMLQESFERISTQILSLYALSKYLATKPELSVSRRVCGVWKHWIQSVLWWWCVCVQWQEERSLGASLMLAGLKQENSVGFSARLLGLALIGVYALVMGELWINWADSFAKWFTDSKHSKHHMLDWSM